MRFEVKYEKNLRRYFDRPVFLLDLCDPAFYWLMVERWQEAYALVRKVKRPVLVPPTSPRHLQRQLARFGLLACGGQAFLMEMLPQWVPDRKKRYNYTALLRDLADGTNEADRVLIEELDAAVDRIVRRSLET